MNTKKKAVTVGRPMVKITETVRLDTVKSVIVEHRAKAGATASYELYGLNYRDNRLQVKRIAHAPTSADFAPMTSKSLLAGYIVLFDILAEFRGAWKTDDVAKVVAYELNNA